MPNTPELVDLEGAKSHLEIAHSDDDELLVDLVTAAESALEEYTNAPIRTASFTEYKDGGTQKFLVRCPLKSGSVTITDTQATVDDSTDDETVESKYYRVRDQEGIILRTSERGIQRWWDPGIRRFKVEYEAGLEQSTQWNRTDRHELARTIKSLVKYHYENRDPGEQREMLGGGFGTTKIIEELPPRVQAVWNRFAELY